jgi:hypothetical protein
LTKSSFRWSSRVLGSVNQSPPSNHQLLSKCEIVLLSKCVWPLHLIEPYHRIICHSSPYGWSLSWIVTSLWRVTFHYGTLVTFFIKISFFNCVFDILTLAFWNAQICSVKTKRKVLRLISAGIFFKEVIKLIWSPNVMTTFRIPVYDKVSLAEYIKVLQVFIFPV